MAFIIDDIIKGIGAKKQAKEQKKAADANLQADYESRLAAEGNTEDSRLARAQALGNALGGSNRALSPEVLQAIMKRKAVTTRKGTAADPSKGIMWNAGGSALGSAGDLGLALLSGLGAQKITGGAAPSGAAPTTLAPPSSPVSFGGKTFDFTQKKDLY